MDELDVNEYFKRKLESVIPGLKDNYIPCNTENRNHKRNSHYKMY